MSSRDRSDQPRSSRSTSRQTSSSRSSDAQWDIDPAEIDRYLSGRPQRTSTSGSSSRQRPAASETGRGGTVDQLAQLRKLVTQDQDAEQAAPAPSPASTSRSRSANTSGSTARTPSVRQTLGRANLASTSRATDTAASDEVAYRESTARTTSSRRVTSRYDYDEDVEPYEEPYDAYDAYDEDGYDDAEPTPRRSRTRRSTPSLPKLTMPALPKITMPSRVSEAAIFSDVLSLSLMGVSALSLAIMAILLANRIDGLPQIISTHVSASGTEEGLASRSALWSIPILGLFLTLMNVAIATFTARIDRFASRFVLAASLLVQIVAWVALLRLM